MDNSVNNNTATGGVFSKISGKYVSSATEPGTQEDDSSYMSFESYLSLLVAQMQNQDFNNPMDDSEVLAQMAQYSMLEGIKNMTQQSSISYGMSLVGKVVTVDDGQGAYTGRVESIAVTDGKAQLMIDGMAYDSDKVTDIVSDNSFNWLMGFIGKTVRLKGSDDPETAATGVVTNFVYRAGKGYVVVNDKLVAASAVEIVDDGKTEGTESTEGTEGTEGTESTEENKGNEDETVTETAEAQTAAEMSTYQVKTESLIDSFMRELDAASGASGVSAVTETSETENDSVMDDYIVETAEVEVQDYAAGIFADSLALSDTETLTGVVSRDGADSTYASGSGTLKRDYDDTEINSYSSSVVNPYTAERMSNGNYKGVTTKAGISTSDSVPHRISVEDYPEEAALADQLGTRMYDIRFINNHAITSRILTDKVIGYSSGGKPVTEIGYSGVGQLGEVVTFANGTQRVEVLLRNGRSCWYTTSGRYTLDEICQKNGTPGSLTGKLTAAESSIRHFSDPTSEMDQSLKGVFAHNLAYNFS